MQDTLQKIIPIDPVDQLLEIGLKDLWYPICPSGFVQQNPVSLRRLGRKLALWGADMIEKLLPAELRATLWTLRERIGSVQITSDEAWIPWEVCRLMHTDAEGRRVEGPFLAALTAIGVTG